MKCETFGINTLTRQNTTLTSMYQLKDIGPNHGRLGIDVFYTPKLLECINVKSYDHWQ